MIRFIWSVVYKELLDNFRLVVPIGWSGVIFLYVNVLVYNNDTTKRKEQLYIQL